MAYAAEHRKEKQREADRRYRERHPDRLKERDRRWREANPEKRAAQKRRNYRRHRYEILAKKHAYYVAVRREAMHAAMLAMPPEEYAQLRARGRVRTAMSAVKSGRLYEPRFSRRIPDWATFGQSIIDAGSQWLGAYITPSQRAYARELAIERKSMRKGI